MKPWRGDVSVPESKKNENSEGKARGKSVLLRQQRIVELVQVRGFASIESLSEKFSVTPQTIRRDINELTEEGLLRRYHGGAGLSSSVENMAYTARKVMCLNEKIRIASMLARHIPNDASLFIDIGTTSEEVAKALLEHNGLRVITNNLNVASILCRRDDFEIIVAGGVLRCKDRGIIGESAIDFIGQFKADFGILSISGIDTDGTLLDFDYKEVRVDRAIIANSKKVCLVADHTKFRRDAMVRLCNVSDIHALYTDRRPPADFVEMLALADVSLYVAEGEGNEQ
jgi:DeoR family transcriptional regulator, glycerol-3-phosphate regulon repressor